MFKVSEDRIEKLRRRGSKKTIYLDPQNLERYEINNGELINSVA